MNNGIFWGVYEILLHKVCGIASGSGVGIESMGVGSLLACGPAGGAVLGIAAVGGAATGAATVAAARKK